MSDDHLIHRDDLPLEAAEAVVKKLQELHPGMRVVFAGDMPPEQLPAGLANAVAAMKQRSDESLLHGTCIDCGAMMPGYPPPGEDMPDGWEPACGWCSFSGAKDEFLGWQCPACDEADGGQD